MKKKNAKTKQPQLNRGNESSTSEDDEDGELLTDVLEQGFFKVLSRLKKKDETLYDENLKFFKSQQSGTDQVDDKHKQKKLNKDYKKWLEGKRKEVEDESIQKDLGALHDYWTDPNLNKDEKFLRDYILNKKFLDHDENFSLDRELAKLDDEEKEVQEQLMFEHKYNTRFEQQIQDLENDKPLDTKKSGKKRKSSSISEVKGDIVKKVKQVKAKHKKQDSQITEHTIKGISHSKDNLAKQEKIVESTIVTPKKRKLDDNLTKSKVIKSELLEDKSDQSPKRKFKPNGKVKTVIKSEVLEKETDQPPRKKCKTNKKVKAVIKKEVLEKETDQSPNRKLKQNGKVKTVIKSEELEKETDQSLKRKLKTTGKEKVIIKGGVRKRNRRRKKSQLGKLGQEPLKTGEYNTQKKQIALIVQHLVKGDILRQLKDIDKGKPQKTKQQAPSNCLQRGKRNRRRKKKPTNK